MTKGFAVTTNADTDATVTKATMYGAEGNLFLHPIPGMTAKLGAGYEQVQWDDDSDPNRGWVANLNLIQNVGEKARLMLGYDYGQVEDRYTAGAEFTVASNTKGPSRLGIEYTYLDSKTGFGPDHRIMAYWHAGFGDGGITSSVMSYTGGAILSVSDEHSHENVLRAVMAKPNYLSDRVVAKIGSYTRPPGSPLCTQDLRAAVVDLQTYVVINVAVALAGFDPDPAGTKLVDARCQSVVDGEWAWVEIGYVYDPISHTYHNPNN